jgi:anthranilate phosphoribosyltransferase
MSRYHSEQAESFRQILIAVAKGKHGAKDMTREQAKEALTFLFSREARPEQVGAFLTAMRFKGTQWEEMAGFLEAMEAHATLIRPKVSGLLNLNGPYDGRKKALNLSLPTAIVMAAAGVPVIMHSGSDLPPKDGVTTGRILEALGVSAYREPEAVAREIEEKGFGHLASVRYLHGVESLKPYRQVLFYRSFLHACEVMLNPAGAEFSMVGAAHDTFLERFAKTQGERGVRRVLAVQGLDGTDELPMHEVAALRYENGQGEGFTLSPSQFGLNEITHTPCPDVAESAKRIEGVLAGEDQALVNAVIYNAGVRLQLVEKCDKIDDGIAQAKELIASGKAKEKLEELRGGIQLLPPTKSRNRR